MNFTININTGLLENNTILAVGTYYLEINATDASNNNATELIKITVQDTNPPTWVEIPENQGIPVGQPLIYDINATDLQVITYSVNNTINFQINGDGVLTNKTVLILGAYFLEINATDASNNNITANIIISVTDNIAPTWDETPQNQTVEFLQFFSYNLNASDAQTVLYCVNDTANFTIDINTGLLENNTILEVGAYPIELTASAIFSLFILFSIPASDSSHSNPYCFSHSLATQSVKMTSIS